MRPDELLQPGLSRRVACVVAHVPFLSGDRPPGNALTHGSWYPGWKQAGLRFDIKKEASNALDNSGCTVGLLGVPPTVDDAAAFAARMAAKKAHASSKPTRGSIRHRIQLRRFAGPVAYLDQISHLRIAHLTDQHVGRITPMEVQRAAVEMTNAEKPDLVLLTGDFVCHSQLYLDQLTEVVSAFRAPVIAVLGNHDHWSGADEVRRALERGGVEVLRNRNTIDHAARRAAADRRPRRRVHRARAPRRGGQGPAQGSADDRPVAHRRGGRRPVAPRRAAGAVGPHPRRPGHGGAAARAGRSA